MLFLGFPGANIYYFYISPLFFRLNEIYFSFFTSNTRIFYVCIDFNVRLNKNRRQKAGGSNYQIIAF